MGKKGTNSTGWPRRVKSGSVVVTVYRLSHKKMATGYVYQLTWRDFDGARRSSQYADEAKALDEADLKAKQMAAGRVGATDVSREDLAFLKAVREASGDTPTLVALDEWKEAQRLTNGQLLVAARDWAVRNKVVESGVLVKDVIDAFIKVKTAAGVDMKASYDRSLWHVLDAFGVRDIVGVTTKEIQAWLDSKFEHEVTRNTIRRRMVTVWRWAATVGYLPRGVKTEAEYTHEAREPDLEIGIIDVATATGLLKFFRKCWGGEFIGPLAIALFGGLRRSELHAQVWEDIHLDRSLLKVTKAKRNTPAKRLVPLCKAAVAWLSLIPKSKRKGKLCRRSDAIDYIRKIGIKAGFKLPKNCFRHSFISHRVAKTGDVPETSLVAGNSPEKIHRHYRELVTKSAGENWFAMKPLAPEKGKSVKVKFVGGQVKIG
jgi:integrase